MKPLLFSVDGFDSLSDRDHAVERISGTTALEVRMEAETPVSKCMQQDLDDLGAACVARDRVGAGA